MGVQWKSHVNPTKSHGSTPEYYGNPTDVPWKYPGIIMGYAMDWSMLPYCFHGIAVGIPWDLYGTSVGLTWPYCLGSPMGLGIRHTMYASYTIAAHK